MSVVLDANVLVAVLVGDEHQAPAKAHLEEWLDAGEDLHAPAVLPYEIASVLARLLFENVLTVEDVGRTWRDLVAFDLQLHPFEFVEDGDAVAAVTTKLRRRHATDSTYVCLAQRLGTTLWTLDAALARNAADIGLPVKLVA